MTNVTTRKFKVRIKFISPYLQGRFSDKAKEELLTDARLWITKNVSEDDLQWVQLSYFDKNGYYIPGNNLEKAIHESGKDFKMKAKKCSIAPFLRATVFVLTDKSYIGKKEPDEKITSYLKRKDGSRVRIIHPAFNPGLEADFELELLDKDFSEKTLKEVIENAGRKCALGTRRPKHGRFEVIEFKQIN
jgi:hypothetical protein